MIFCLPPPKMMTNDSKMKSPPSFTAINPLSFWSSALTNDGEMIKSLPTSLTARFLQNHFRKSISKTMQNSAFLSEKALIFASFLLHCFINSNCDSDGRADHGVVAQNKYCSVYTFSVFVLHLLARIARTTLWSFCGLSPIMTCLLRASFNCSP